MWDWGHSFGGFMFGLLGFFSKLLIGYALGMAVCVCGVLRRKRKKAIAYVDPGNVVCYARAILILAAISLVSVILIEYGVIGNDQFYQDMHVKFYATIGGTFAEHGKFWTIVFIIYYIVTFIMGFAHGAISDDIE